MKKIGWVQWAPGQKHHFIVQRPNGWYWTACGNWGTDYHKIVDRVSDPIEKKKCKNCLRKLEESRQ